MVKSKNSASLAVSRRLQAVEQEIARLEGTVDSVVGETKARLWETYRSFPHGSEPGHDAELRALLDDYEPTITEEAIADLEYGPRASYMAGDVSSHLVESLPDGMDATNFYILWSGLKRQRKERADLIAGQIPLDLFRG